jgi:circadian clock protein KaiB
MHPHADDALAASIRLKLYVAGIGSRSDRALANLERICAGMCSIEVIDIVARPDLAEQDRILATPVVIREHPQPARRVVGDLADEGGVALGLDLPMPQGGAA